jgi:hypothetical protein
MAPLGDMDLDEFRRGGHRIVDWGSRRSARRLSHAADPGTDRSGRIACHALCAGRHKIMRLHAQTATIENGFVHLPEEAHWLADYLAELTVFPAGCHDDQVDSTAQALAWAKLRPAAWGLVEYYGRELERLMGSRGEPAVRICAPDGVSNVHGLSGRAYLVYDHIVEVEPRDTPPLLAAGFHKFA